MSSLVPSPPSGPPPRCPVTGAPATRFLQWVDAGLLARLWRLEFRVDARPSFGGIPRFALWESPSGLRFFDPPCEGSAQFYRDLYARLGPGSVPTASRPRAEFQLAATHVSEGLRVLDVGCGNGPFRACLPDGAVDYTGLDPNFGGRSETPWIRAESLPEHLATHAGAYDVVCAFQVIEHVARPAAFFADLCRAARPGGTVIVGVPHVPSALSRIPNFMINAPPHHLTWWTREALVALCDAECADLVDIAHVPWCDLDAFVYWMARSSFVQCRDVHYADRADWHLATVTSLAAGKLLAALRGPPPAGTDEGGALLLVATTQKSSDR